MVQFDRRGFLSEMKACCQQITLFLVCLGLIACGGGGGSNSIVASSSKAPSSSKALSSTIPVVSSHANSSPLNLISSSASSFSSISLSISLSGRITYDQIPYSSSDVGLDYSAVEIKPGRGLVVELLDGNNQVLSSTITDVSGLYSFNVKRNQLAKVRVKAQLVNSQSPAWDFRVTDNTNNNALYAMDGSLIAVTEATAVRNLHAASGWTGDSYTQPRAAAPFAIADAVYTGVARVNSAGNQQNFPPLELRWSPKNKTAYGDASLGEIGTTYYGGDAIYILGDENNDTDEYDRHVILHEWGHYVEMAFSRSDSIGGDHGYSDKLDMRVALSEGFANAFSAMMLDDPGYRDTSGAQQATGFVDDISRKSHYIRGWYSEASVQSILYNFYTSNNGKIPREFADIFNVMVSPGYSQSSSLTSIYSFADELRKLMREQVVNFNNLLLEQNIGITDAFGAGETNSGSYAGSLPVYKSLPLNNLPVNVCSTNRFGSYNKLGVTQFFLINIIASGNYGITAIESSESGDSDPDLYLYSNGLMRAKAEAATVDQEKLSLYLNAGTHVLEVVDARATLDDGMGELTACFNVQMQQLK